MKKFLIALIVFNFSTCFVYSQSKTIEGRVITNNFETVPGAIITVNDTVKVGTTNLNGFFQIDIPESNEKILIRYVGLDPANIEIEDKCKKIEVVMMLSGARESITLKRAEKNRKKRYDKLPKLHKRAFEKGIFETEEPCYNRKYEPYYLDND